MKNQLNFTFRAVKDGKTISRCQTHSKRRFYNRIGMINWQNGLFVYLRVNYGKGLNNYGEMVPFYNDGDYQIKSDLLEALSAFTEKAVYPENRRNKI